MSPPFISVLCYARDEAARREVRDFKTGKPLEIDGILALAR